MSSNSKVLVYLLALLSIPSLVHAHLIGGSGALSGLTHPLLGLDHVLEMIAVGIISVRFAQKFWVVPATFVTCMVIGGLIAMTGVVIPFVEIGIAISVVVLGVLIAFHKKSSLGLALVLVALFAVFHGHAHGQEMPLIANPAWYAAGFVLSTTALHIFGVILGQYAIKDGLRLRALKAAGAGMALFGMVLLAAF